MKRYSSIIFFAIVQLLYIAIIVGLTYLLIYKGTQIFFMWVIAILGLIINSCCLYTESKRIFN